MQAVFNSDAKIVVVLGMGGTIAGEAGDPAQTLAYTAAARPVTRLIADLPSACQAQIEATGYTVLSESVAQIDSKDVRWEHWWRLARRISYWLNETRACGVVVTHGTDTLEETAWFLQQVLSDQVKRKPVVITCAMRPATALEADGPQNLTDAIVVATSGAVCGVTACVAGEIFSARSVQKVHPTRLNAFDGGESGPIATIHSGAIQPARAVAPKADVAPTRWAKWLAMDVPLPKQPWVECILHTGAASPHLLPVLANAQIDGLVVAATGNGTINDEWLAQLQSMSASGVEIRCATRCNQGELVGDKTKCQTLSGLPYYPHLNAVKSRVQLCLDLL